MLSFFSLVSRCWGFVLQKFKIVFCSCFCSDHYPVRIHHPLSGKSSWWSSTHLTEVFALGRGEGAVRLPGRLSPGVISPEMSPRAGGRRHLPGEGGSRVTVQRCPHPSAGFAGIARISLCTRSTVQSSAACFQMAPAENRPFPGAFMWDPKGGPGCCRPCV